jgi:hypothetical protein
MANERIQIVKFDRGGSLVILGYYKTKQEACNALSEMGKKITGFYVMTAPGEFFNAAGEKVKIK